MQVGHDVLVQSAPVAYNVVVEESPVDVDNTYPYEGRNDASTFRVRISTIMALTMAILGSSVVPVSFAFATTGITCGLLISLVVALCNTYTCQLLLSAASATRTSTFEELTDSVGGKALMRLAQLSNIILLFGNLTGDFCLLADLGSKSLTASLGDDAPWILVGNHGRGIMLLLVLAVIFPLSLFRGMRALETVSAAGMGVVLLLFGVLTYDAATSGFRGVTSGEVPLWSLSGASSAEVADAFSLIGFSFYLHPLMMPMLTEMPPGQRGVNILSDSVTLVIMGVAFVTISGLAAMGAAAFGADTQGDILMNQLLQSKLASLLLALMMLLYLASCIPPIVLSLRCYLDFIIAGPRAGFRCASELYVSAVGARAALPCSPAVSFLTGVQASTLLPVCRLPRFLALTVAIVAVPIAMAWGDPSLSERAFALTGATGVCIVCYIIPVIVHFMLLFRGKTPAGSTPSIPRSLGEGHARMSIRSCDGSEGSGASTAAARWLLEEDSLQREEADVGGVAQMGTPKPYAPRPETLWEWAGQALVPALVLLIGVCLSVLSLLSSLRPHQESLG